MRTLKSLETHQKPIYISLLLISVCISIYFAYVHMLNMDEREHLYASFMIYSGYIPYKDFFEHHHPLLWYLFAPILNFCDNTPYIWYIIRTFGLIILSITTFLVYKLALFITNNKTTALTAIIIYLGFETVGYAGTEFRPDNLMICLFLAGLYQYLKYLKQDNWKNLAKAYFLFFLSLLTLQKIIVLLSVMGLIIFFLAYRHKKIRTVFITLLLPLSATLLYGLYLYHYDTLKIYLESNWILHKYFRFHPTFKFIKTIFYFLPSLGAVLALFLSKKSPVSLNIIKILYLVCFIFILILSPSSQYLLPCYPFLAIIFADFLSTRFEKYSLIILCLYTATSLYSAIKLHQSPELGPETHTELSKIIINNSNKDDLIVSDMFWSGGLRRSAYGYYWFSIGGISLLDYKLFHHHELPDLNRIISIRKPKIVANAPIFDCLTENHELLLIPDCTLSQSISENATQDNYLKSEFIYLRIK